MPHALPTPIIDLKAFVPAKDFALSQQFYADLGFHTQWADQNTAELRLGSFGFLLQAFYVEQHAGNFMMHLMVEDADVWWQHIETVGFRSKYPGIMLEPPELQPWGLRVLYLSDPSGVLWHIADRRS
jgi:catechol 2,3-dioxygenase-like lactoylglutathione lyase family enzyme